MFSGDPLHMQSQPDTVWATGNVTEAIPRSPTPLTWSFFASMIHESMIGALIDMGVMPRNALDPDYDHGDPPIGVFYGQPAGNIALFLSAAAATPGNSAAAVELQTFGTTIAADRHPNHRRRYPMIAMRMPKAMLTVSGTLARQKARSVEFWRSVVKSEPDLRQSLELVEEAARRFIECGRPHLLQLMVAQGIYEQLASLTRRAGHPGLETALLTGSEDLEEAGLVDGLSRVASGRDTMDAFLAVYGYHAPNEGEISNFSWREKPSQLDTALAGYTRVREDPTRLDGQRLARRDEAEQTYLRGLPLPLRPVGKLVLQQARRAVPMRNVGKNAYLRLIDVARFAARRIGQELAGAGVFDTPDDVFYLTQQELLVGQYPAHVKDLISERRERREHYRTCQVRDTSWVGMPLLRDDEEIVSAGLAEALTGIPVCAGVFEGTVRVIADPTAIEEPISGDEVIVARTTDPSWASIMISAGAFVIDIGGPMSHAAIVARELGVPCVIGTDNGSTVLRDGARVRVDGMAGTVEVLS
jgi:phosphohistidine swiveling domain-containing protein